MGITKIKSLLLFGRMARNKKLNIRKTIALNFRFLPRSQAWKFPIFVYGKMKIEGTGTIVINGPLHPGLIQIGCPDYLGVSTDPSLFYNYGTVVFHGMFVSSYATTIAAHNKIQPAVIEFGANVVMGMKNNFQAFDRIEIGAHTHLAHYVQVFDTNFHYVVDTATGEIPSCTSPVFIGKNCWIGNYANIMKKSYIPDGVVVAAGSLANKDYRGILPEYSVAAGCPMELKTQHKRRIVDYQTEQLIHKHYADNSDVLYRTPQLNVI